MKVFQLTVHFSPNLGGVETHLDDLMSGLIAKRHQVFVLTYRPLSTKTQWHVWQNKPNLRVLRLPWLPGFFNKLARIPIGEFFYLSPGLFLTMPFALIWFRPDVIHAHGVVAGLIAVFWGRLFGIRTVISTHSIYHFPPTGLYRSAAIWLFSHSNHDLCLSDQSCKELIELGIDKDKVSKFTYWVDLDKFKPLGRPKLKSKFIVLFVGRLVSEKGIPELLQAAKMFKSGITLQIAGSGPLESQVHPYWIGRISQSNLPKYYSKADLVIVPSTHEEGFGRVIIESLACGTPVIAANRGAIPEAMDESVGRLIDINPKNIQAVINYLSTNQKIITKMKKKAREFAVKRYSYHNIDQIITYYKASS